jgi:hypothetical protein
MFSTKNFDLIGPDAFRSWWATESFVGARPAAEGV